MLSRFLLIAAFVMILGVPFLLRPAPERSAEDQAAARTLIIVTPHVPQIREEFGRAFSAWHKRVHGSAVRVDWRTPGGTSEILKQLSAQYTAAIRNGLIAPDGAAPAGTVGLDLMFGGGTFDHGRLKQGVTVELSTPQGAKKVTVPMSVPAGFTAEQLQEWFGENTLGSGFLYDPEQFWIGTALSGFGIVYNRDVFRELALPEPKEFADLCDPRLQGWIALADPRQSGSVTTTFEAILNFYDWDRGWRILREMAANTRYFTNSATKPPIDVSQGEAAAGLAIDFYGRGQAQSIVRAGEDPKDSRVGYVDPKGSTYIDADPASILRGGPSPDLAKRFVEFCLTEEAQALWQFRSTRDPNRNLGRGTPARTADGIELGPKLYELRRMPARRMMYEKHWDRLIDQVQPWELAAKVKGKGWRSAIGPMMGCFAIDIIDDQRAAWAALNRARRAANFPAEALAEMETLFYRWPSTTIENPTIHPLVKALSKDTQALLRERPQARTYPGLAQLAADASIAEAIRAELKKLAEAPRTFEFTPENYQVVRDSWRDPGFMARAEIAYTEFFRAGYRRIIELERASASRR